MIYLEVLHVNCIFATNGSIHGVMALPFFLDESLVHGILRVEL